MTAAFGAMALAVQVVFIRQLMVAFLGNEIIIALVLAGWLVGVAVGAKVMGWVSSGRSARAWLWVLPPGWVVLGAFLLGISFILPDLIGVSPGEAASVGAAFKWSLLLAAPAGLFVGALFVAAGSAWDFELAPAGPDRLAVGGTIFYAESAGSCLGLLAYAYWLAGRMGPVEVYAIFAGLVLLLWVLTMPRLASTRLAGAAGLILIAVLFWSFDGPGRLDQAADQARFARAHPGYELLAARDTPYQHLSIGGRAGERALFGNEVFMNSWPDPYTYEQLTLFFLTEANSYDRVLLVGQGPGGFIHELLAGGVKKLVYITVDPDETGLATEYLPPEMARDLADPRVTIVHADPRRALADRNFDPFDLAIIAAPDPDNARINRLYTLEFFQAVRSRLNARGVLITSVTGAVNYWSPDLLSYGGSLYRTLRRVFPQVLVTPGDTHHFIAGVQPGLVTSDTEVLADRFRERGFSSPYLTPRSLTVFFPPTEESYVRSQLQAAERAGPVNTDRRPLTYYLRLVWWEQMTGPEWTGALMRGLLQVDCWGSWALVLLLLPLLAAVLRPGPARVAGWTMFSTGAVVMALQVLLIFMFQNHYGVVYRDIALLSALFMAGAAGGGFLGRLAAGLAAGPGLLLPVLEIALAGLAAMIFWTARMAATELILPLAALTGLAGGMQFALLYAFYLTGRTRPDASAALSGLEAADHAGAVVGALAGGLVLTPVLGLPASAAGLAAFKAVSALAMLRMIRK